MKTSILTELHRAAGAAFVPGAPSDVLFFRDVPDEYRAASDGAALLDRTDRGLVVARGVDAQNFLHRLLANEVRKLAPGRGNRNLLLDAKGKLKFQFDLAVAANSIELSTEPGRAKALADALEHYHFAEKVTFADESERHAPIGLVGVRAIAIAKRVLGEFAVPELGDFVELAFGSGSVRATRTELAGSDGLLLDGGPKLASELWSRAVLEGATPCGRVVYDSLRVEAGAIDPELDVDDNVYPQEARLERAFSLDKGCYIGQEVVAKIDTYGGLNKRLVALKVSSDDPVARGSRLSREDQGERRELGIVTSWAYSFVLDGGVVLAYVKRRHQKVGTSFQIGDGPLSATIVALPIRANAAPVTGEFE